MSGGKPIRRMITMPYGAVFCGEGHDEPNEILFNETGDERFRKRHTLVFATVGDEIFHDGMENWMVIEEHSGLLYAPLQGSDAVQVESGIFQNGVKIVRLKVPARSFGLDVLLRGKDRCHYEKARFKFGYTFSPDHANSLFQNVDYPIGAGDIECGQFQPVASDSDIPNLWTYTYEGCNGERFHIDFILISQGNNDNDASNPDAFASRISLNLFAPDPKIYGDTKIIPLSGGVFRYNALVCDRLNGTFPDTVHPSTFASEAFKYEGGARGHFKAVFNAAGNANIVSVGVENLTDGVTSRFRHVDWPHPALPTTGWLYTDFEIDTEKMLFTATGGAVNLMPSVHPLSTFSKLMLQPGKTYRFFVEVSSGSATVTGELTYRSAYWGF